MSNKEAQAANEELDRPFKRLRQKYKDGQGFSLNAPESSVPKMPLITPKEEQNDIPETHLQNSIDRKRKGVQPAYDLLLNQRVSEEKSTAPKTEPNVESPDILTPKRNSVVASHASKDEPITDEEALMGVPIAVVHSGNFIPSDDLRPSPPTMVPCSGNRQMDEANELKKFIIKAGKKRQTITEGGSSTVDNASSKRGHHARGSGEEVASIRVQEPKPVLLHAVGGSPHQYAIGPNVDVVGVIGMPDDDVSGDDQGTEGHDDAARAREGKEKKKKKKGKVPREGSWLLTGECHGGPLIPDLIPSFGGHIAYDIWEGNERPIPRCHHRTVALEAWAGPTDDTSISLLRNSGLYHLRECTYKNPDSPLLAAFIERWQPDCNTFHMPFGEMTITLHDVHYMMGLNVDGHFLHPTTRADTIAQYKTLVGLTTSVDVGPELRDGGPKYEKIRDYYDLLESSENATSQTKVRLYLLYLISATLFIDRSTNKVKVEFLHLLSETEKVANYAWGAGVLTHLYRSLGETSRADTRQMCGCLTLLECWIYEYFPCFRPPINPDYRPDQPRAYRWYNPYRTPSKEEGQLVYYRRILDRITERDVYWIPSDRNVVREVPKTLYMGSIRCLGDTEGYMPNSVLRQFGFIQTIPGGRLKPNPGCYRGRNPKLYTVQYPDTDPHWLIKGLGGLDILVYGKPAKPRWAVALGYIAWYHDHTHLQIHREENVQRGLFLPPAEQSMYDVGAAGDGGGGDDDDGGGDDHYDTDY